MTEREAGTEIMMLLLEHFLKVLSVFKELNRKFIFILLLNKAKNLKPFSHVQRYWFNFIGIQKIFIW
jgi:hypothetical protein